VPDAAYPARLVKTLTQITATNCFAIKIYAGNTLYQQQKSLALLIISRHKAAKNRVVTAPYQQTAA